MQSPHGFSKVNWICHSSETLIPLTIPGGQGEPIGVVFCGRMPAKNDTLSNSPPPGAGLGVGEIRVCNHPNLIPSGEELCYHTGEGYQLIPRVARSERAIIGSVSCLPFFVFGPDRE